MALASFTVKNYRSFIQETVVELRPLTLLFGANNSGKSTLLRVLPLLAESARPSDSDDVLACHNDVTRQSSFGEMIPRLPGTAANLQLALAWDDADSRTRAVRWSFRQMAQLGRRAQVIAERIQIWGEGAEGLLDLEWSDGGGPGAPNYRPAGGGETKPLRLNGLMPEDAAPQSPLGELAGRLRALSEQVLWLGAVREPPPRILRSAELTGRPRRVGSRGGEVVPLLVRDKQEKGPLLPAVSRFYEQHFQRTLDVRETANGDSYAVLARGDSPELGVNLADSGEGITQVLPVIMACALAEQGRLGSAPVLALEQPELHLHSDAQEAVAAHLCSLAAGPLPVRLLVETHSELFLLQLELAVLEGRLPPDRVLLYHVWMSEGGQSHLRRIPLDAQGRPEGLPRMFGESLDLARRIAVLRRGNAA